MTRRWAPATRVAVGALIALVCGVLGLAWAYGMGPLTCGTAPPTSGCVFLQRLARASLALLGGGVLALVAAAVLALRRPAATPR